MRSNLLALTASLAASALADFDCHGPYFSFYNRAGPAMSYQRLDPALFPGQESPHLHSFDGGNAVASDMTFDLTQTSTCTTARIKPDKSLYWRPTLFWNGNNTGFYRVPDKQLKVYYKFGDGDDRANVTEFPEDFAMIAGSAMKRADGDNPAGVKWACLGDNYSRIDATGFPKGFTSCKEGLTAELTFPSCWNGQPIDPKNPNAHMAYPSNSGKGIDVCPDGFKVARFPAIFIEFWYDVSSFDGTYSADDVPWVLANGDSTGYGFHADFRNGWEKGVLAKATAETGYCNCGCGCGNDQMKECFGAENVNDDNEDFKSCTATSPEYPGDDKSPLEKLPGCNPIQSGPASATQATGPDCTAPAAAGGSKASASVSGSSAASQITSAASSSKASSTATSSTAASAADVEAVSSTNSAPSKASQSGEVSMSKVMSPSHSISGKGDDYQTVGGDDSNEASATGSAKASATVVAGESSQTTAETHPTDLPSLSLASSGVSSGSSPSETGSSKGGQGEGDEQCSAPTTVTVTPTIFVTAGGSQTSCNLGTVTQTVKHTATVTVTAGGNYKRHIHMHQHHKH